MSLPYATKKPTLSLILAVQLGIGVLLGGGALWYLLHVASWHETLRSLGSISPRSFAAGAFLFCLGSLLGALRWKLLLREHNASPIRLFVVQNTGLGVDALSPVRIFSVPIQLFLLTQGDRVPLAPALASISAKRLMDVCALGCILAVGLLGTHALRPALTFVVPALAWSALTWSGMLAVGRFSQAKGETPVQASQPPVVAGRGLWWIARNYSLAVALAVASWVCIGLGAWVIAQDYGMALPIVSGVAIGVATIVVAGALPGLPAAFGAFEFAFVQLVGMMGYDKGQAIAVALAFHAAILGPALVITFITLAGNAKLSLRTLLALPRTIIAVGTDSLPGAGRGPKPPTK